MTALLCCHFQTTCADVPIFFFTALCVDCAGGGDVAFGDDGRGDDGSGDDGGVMVAVVIMVMVAMMMVVVMVVWVVMGLWWWCFCGDVLVLTLVVAFVMVVNKVMVDVRGVVVVMMLFLVL